MTDEKDETLEAGVAGNAPEILDLGDAAVETKQVSSPGSYPDCYFGFGTRWGCGG